MCEENFEKSCQITFTKQAYNQTVRDKDMGVDVCQKIADLVVRWGLCPPSTDIMYYMVQIKSNRFRH